MSNAPVSWRNILVVENIGLVMELQVCISNMESQLFKAARTQSQAVVTRENLSHLLHNGVDVKCQPADHGQGFQQPS